MKRRRFLHVSIAASALPIAAGMPFQTAAARRFPTLPLYKVIFEDSIRECRAFAGAARRLSAVTCPMRGDITDVWYHDLHLRWREQPAAVQRGHEIFQRWCTPCHGAGPHYPGTDALAAKYKGEKPATLEERTDLTPDLTRQFVRHGASIMPFFRKTEISDADLDALAACLARHKP